MILNRLLRLTVWTALACSVCLVAACAPRINLGGGTDKLREVVLSGKGSDKILVVNIRGVITSFPKTGLLRDRPGQIQDIAAQLEMAQDDPKIRGVLFLIESPGGTTTASDILREEIEDFRRRSGRKTAALIMTVGASGGYMAAVACERISAHPTSLVGSVGTVFIAPKVDGLLDKIGVRTEVAKSGEHKDMGSPFRPATDEERAMTRAIIADLNARFLEEVARSRRLTPEGMAEVAQGRIYTASQARDLGLIDEVGYQREALAGLRALAGLPNDVRVVAYRRGDYAEDNIYNNIESMAGGGTDLLGLRELWPISALSPGFHHLYLPAAP